MLSVYPDLMRDIPADQVEQALALGSRVAVHSGKKLFSLGEAADRIFIIERGRIRLTLPMKVRGNEEEVMVEERQPGETVGWSALIPPYRYTLSATAPLETDVIAISRDALGKLFEARPDTGYAVTRNLAAVIGQRLQLFQTMWLREMQRTVELRLR